jgi:CHAT domain-containing protein
VIPPSANAASGRPSPEYLIDRYEVRLLPSTQFLLGATAGIAMRPGFRVVALSYAVPGGAAELAAVRHALDEGRVLTREGSGATEHAALTASADVLHLAVHSLVNDRDPLASHLLLPPQGTDDGFLHLSEITGRRLAPRLVVLSACEAVNGRLYAGEGLVGLARAFLVGGTRQVVASEWPVDSSAAGLMGAFYSHLERGMPPAAALRAAQLALRRQPATAHPIHWAGFVVFEGDASRGRGAVPDATAN